MIEGYLKHVSSLGLIDMNPQQPFDFFLEHYKEQLMAGYTKTTLDFELCVFMRDFIKVPNQPSLRCVAFSRQSATLHRGGGCPPALLLSLAEPLCLRGIGLSSSSVLVATRARGTRPLSYRYGEEARTICASSVHEEPGRDGVT